MIPKALHLIWIGDDTKRPDNWIKTWHDNHATWEFKLWGNVEYKNTPWICQRQMDVFYSAGLLEGVADIMRYEILHRYGGIYVDADSISLRPLDDVIRRPKMFAVWESERHSPNLVANSFIGGVPGHPALKELISEIAIMSNPLHTDPSGNIVNEVVLPWKSVGPILFSRVLLSQPSSEFTIFPSAYFIPQHYKDTHERTPNGVYARHFWSTTKTRLEWKSKHRRRVPFGQ